MDFRALALESIRALETEHGILASSRSEIYGCVFGRDSLITSLKLLRAHRQKPDPYYLSLVAKVLRNLAALQGKEVNLESGEEPGKCIHEWRPTGHEHLTKHASQPWYLYPDNVMRNYDTVDATPLFLMTVHEYLRQSDDERFAREIEPAVRAALSWLLEYSDSNGDGLIDYRFNPERKFGGLRTQSWMDSVESVFFENDTTHPAYPIAPVEVQAYAYAALLSWADHFSTRDVPLSLMLSSRALDLRKRFNETFLLRNRRKGYARLAFAIDGEGRPMVSSRSSMGHVLWAVAHDAAGAPRSILEDRYVEGVVHRLMSKDLFVPRAGIRTLSSRSRGFDPMSYHNGSIWPHDSEIVAEGFQNFGYIDEARAVRAALRNAYSHFKTPIELFAFSRGRYREYTHASGMGGACRVQAWSAAALLLASE